MVFLCFAGVLPDAVRLRAERERRAEETRLPAAAPSTEIGLELVEKTTAAGPCVAIAGIRAGSRASDKNLRKGDVLAWVGRQPVTSLQAAQDAIAVWLSDQAQPLPLVFERGRTKLMANIIPASGVVRPARDGGSGTEPGIGQRGAARAQRALERRTLAHGELTDAWAIPGMPARPKEAAGINVLRRVFLDPRTGEVAFVGYYEPAFATGAIDYGALLRDALRSPAPVFSLEPTPEAKTAVDSFVRRFDGEMARTLGSVESGKAWLTGVFDALVSDPALELDRQRFLQRSAELFKIRPDEVPGLVQAMLGRAAPGSEDMLRLCDVVYGRLGAPEIARFLRAGKDKAQNPDPFWAALRELGVWATLEDLRSQVSAGRIPQAIGDSRLLTHIWISALQRCHVPESRWRSLAERALATDDNSAFLARVNEINLDLIREALMDPWLDGLVLSEEFLRRKNALPALEIHPVCGGGLVPDSELAQTFLAADWVLKTLTVSPELSARVPGHLTPTQFIFRRESATGAYDVGNVEFRFWLTPPAVTLRHDETNGIVDFGEANPRVRAEVLSHRGGSPAAARLTRETLSAYGDEISRRYDEYARALPELHRLREAAKLIALVRWARGGGLRLAAPEPAAATPPLPTRFQRSFWSGFFLSNPEKTFFGLAASGGVDFGENNDDWVQPAVDPGLKTTALGQLVGSAGLGRLAADAALRGDLEAARALADQSARAMTGDFDFSGNPALWGIPEASPPSPYAQAELQAELAQQGKAAIESLAQVRRSPQPAGGDVELRQQAEAEQHLQQIRGLLDHTAADPAEARHWVKLLRGGEWEALPKRPPAAAGAAADGQAERDRLRGEITALRTELCRVNHQLRRFNSTIQMNEDQRAEWEKRVNDAYQSALDRVKEKLKDFSLEYPTDKLKEKLEKLTDPVERAKVERALRLVRRLQDAYTVKDFASWVANGEFTRQEILEGIKLIADTLGVEDSIKDHLVKRWGLQRFRAYYEAANDLLTSAFDVTSEIIAWRRLNEINRHSDEFLRAVEQTTRRQREVMEQIRQREIALGLDPSATKEPCEP